MAAIDERETVGDGKSSDSPGHQRSPRWWISIICVTILCSIGRVVIYPIYEQNPAKGVAISIGAVALTAIISALLTKFVEALVRQWRASEPD